MVQQPQPKLHDSREFFYIAISMLELESKTSLIPELMQVLGPRQLVTLSEVFGGKSVKFPTRRELAMALKAALYTYHVDIDGMTPEAAAAELDLAGRELEDVLERSRLWKSRVSAEAGSEFYQQLVKHAA